MKIKFEKLTKTYLEDSINLIKKNFDKLTKNEYKEIDELLLYSLDKEKYKKDILKYKITDLEYYIVFNEENKLIGITGLYKETDNTLWIGWFCLEQNERKKGLGEKILDFIINKAKEKNFNKLHVYTYDSDFYKPAINLYKKKGFREFYRKEKDLFLVKDLK